jgi:uncharacterized protein YjbI with pentapeptide repeats
VSARRTTPSLSADCSRCVGLCCVAPAFSASADFAIDKPAGHPCLNLRDDFRCGIHDRLRSNGFQGCTTYDCFGAGQQVSQVTFGGRNWRAEPPLANAMFGSFAVMRQLHELLWYLTESVSLPAAAPLHADLRDAVADTERLTHERSEVLVGLDVAAHRDRVNALLLRTSELARAASSGPKADHRGGDLIGADLRGADLRGATLRGARLIAADLRRADLRGADLIGADLRDSDIRGADLTGCIFLIQSQIDSAKGDARTQLPPSFIRPSHWPRNG